MSGEVPAVHTRTHPDGAAGKPARLEQALQRDRADEAVGAKHPVIRGSLHRQGGPPDPTAEISRPGGLAARFARATLARGTHKPSAPPRPNAEPRLEQADPRASDLDPIASA